MSNMETQMGLKIKGWKKIEHMLTLIKRKQKTNFHFWEDGVNILFSLLSTTKYFVYKTYNNTERQREGRLSRDSFLSHDPTRIHKEARNLEMLT